MSHTVTVHDIVWSLAIFVGFLLASGGLAVIFGAGMSDAPAQSRPIARKGCIAAIIGVVLIVIAIRSLIL